MNAVLRAVPAPVTEAHPVTPVPLPDPGSLRIVQALYRAATRIYHRAEVKGIENVPASGGALIVSNHSGGVIAMDVPVIATAFWEHFGLDRPLHTLAHDVVTRGPLAGLASRFGLINATRENARAALSAGGVTIVFPGGDWDAFRPTSLANVIDFNGRTGYVRTALEAGVPIVPAVSIGGQETMLVLTRGQWLGRRSPLKRLIRSDIAPFAIGFPFGLTPAGLPNLPLPSKISTRILAPIDLRAEFGPDPDLAEVDAVIRERMQDALDELARERRFPVLG